MLEARSSQGEVGGLSEKRSEKEKVHLLRERTEASSSERERVFFEKGFWKWGEFSWDRGKPSARAFLGWLVEERAGF